MNGIDNVQPIAFWGAGSHALVLRQMLGTGSLRLTALFSDLNEPSRFEVPILVGEQNVRAWVAELSRVDACRFAVAIGGTLGSMRLEKHRFLKQLGLLPQTLVHETATVLSDQMGEGCQILAGSVVGVDARLGASVIVNTSASVDHECDLGDGVHIGPGAVLAGRICVGARTFVGAGATVAPDVKIAADCIVGAGAVVVKDIVESGVYIGVPARRLLK